ncbi:MFS transporter [Actinoplanes sp. CA-252034]|uniref:MFS transporter n=1 Tax=Actinoplanes sp. CA-252034 TaxID=3239906 RepID=UPI003D99F87A
MYRYTANPRPDAFVRDAPTVLAYAALGCFTFWLYAFGPALTLLRDELRFSYTLLGVYSTLWAAGAALAGASFTRLARRLPRSRLLWGSAIGAAAGAVLFTLGGSVPVTLVGAGVFGLAGTTMLTVIQAILSDRHGSRREQALTEANIGAGASAVLAPLALGALAGGVVGWRAVFALPMVVLAALYLRFRREPLTTATPRHPDRPPRDRTAPYDKPPPPSLSTRTGRDEHSPPRPRMPAGRYRARTFGGLPAACWMFAVLTAIGSAIEFCLVYFGPQMLVTTGLSATAAGTALGSNLFGILVGRIVGARLTRRPGRTVTLLYASLAITAVGFLLFWLTGHPTAAILGLFVCGLGIANLYPLSLALTFDAADGRDDEANARSQVVLGLVAAASPYLLGSLADRYGLTAAFTLEPTLIVLSVLLLAAGLRAHSRVARSTADEVTTPPIDPATTNQATTNQATTNPATSDSLPARPGKSGLRA